MFNSNQLISLLNSIKYMPRKKEYIEDKVIEKAMDVFWRHGYKSTSMRMLEKEMGINQFSINASFGNKKQIFLHCVKCYKKKLNPLINKLDTSVDGTNGIRQYFYDFVNFTRFNHNGRGCLINNIINEFGDQLDPKIQKEIKSVEEKLTRILREKLKVNTNTSNKEREINYLLMCLFGLSAGSRSFKQSQIVDFIESIFEKL